MQHDPLHFDPFLLLLRETIRALPPLDLLVELVHDDRDEKVHDEEGLDEDEDDEEDRGVETVVLFRAHVLTLRIDDSKEARGPGLEGGHLEESDHREHNVVEVIEWYDPLSRCFFSINEIIPMAIIFQISINKAEY